MSSERVRLRNLVIEAATSASDDAGRNGEEHRISPISRSATHVYLANTPHISTMGKMN